MWFAEWEGGIGSRWRRPSPQPNLDSLGEEDGAFQWGEAIVLAKPIDDIPPPLVEEILVLAFSV